MTNREIIEETITNPTSPPLNFAIPVNLRRGFDEISDFRRGLRCAYRVSQGLLTSSRQMVVGAAIYAVPLAVALYPSSESWWDPFPIFTGMLLDVIWVTRSGLLTLCGMTEVHSQVTSESWGRSLQHMVVSPSMVGWFVSHALLIIVLFVVYPSPYSLTASGIWLYVTMESHVRTAKWWSIKLTLQEFPHTAARNFSTRVSSVSFDAALFLTGKTSSFWALL